MQGIEAIRIVREAIQGATRHWTALLGSIVQDIDGGHIAPGKGTDLANAIHDTLADIQQLGDTVNVAGDKVAAAMEPPPRPAQGLN